MTALHTELDQQPEQDWDSEDNDTTRTPPHGTRPSSARRFVLIGLVVALVAAGVAIAALAWPSTPETFTVNGVVTLGNEAKGDPKTVGKPCSATPTGGFGDIHKGTQVVISDRSGGTVGLGVLQGGIEQGGPKVGYRCVFAFTVTNVPADADFYGVALGQRGRVQYAESTIRKQKITLLFNS